MYKTLSKTVVWVEGNTSLPSLVMATFLMLTTLVGNAQETEWQTLSKELNLLVDMNIGKVKAATANGYAQQEKIVGRAFNAFAAHPNSYYYQGLKTNKDSVKLLWIDKRAEVSIYTHTTGGARFGQYSISSMAFKAYLVKDLEKNTIVYQGPRMVHQLQAMHRIDSTHFLLIEKVGDGNTSRQAVVLTTKKDQWQPIKAFKGMAFGQVEGAYFEKKFTAVRTYLQLECERDVAMLAKIGSNDILFDEKTKTISYQNFNPELKKKVIEAKWTGIFFAIDDINLGEFLRSDGVAAPY